MIPLGLQRHDGPLARIGVGCWALDVAGRLKPLVLWRCPTCGGVDAIDPHDVQANGDVLHPQYCQQATCSPPFASLLRLENWPGIVVDTSDVERSP